MSTLDYVAKLGIRTVPSAAVTQIASNFPPELLALPQWVVADGKTPLDAKTGKAASSTDPSTWATFREAATSLLGGKGDGLGLVLSESDPYCGIDIDDCLQDDELDEDAEAIMHALDSYTEVSRSGTGLHVFIRGTKPGPKCRSRERGVEIYDRSRFFVVTGNRVLGRPKAAEERQEWLDALYRELFGEDEAQGEAKAPAELPSSIPNPVQLDDSVLIQRACKANAKLARLIRGDYSRFPDRSEGDYVLAWELLYWTRNDLNRVVNIIMNSQAYREKFDRKDYLMRQAKAALAARESQKVYGGDVFEKEEAKPLISRYTVTNDPKHWVSASEITSRTGLNKNQLGRLMKELGLKKVQRRSGEAREWGYIGIRPKRVGPKSKPLTDPIARSS